MRYFRVEKEVMRVAPVRYGVNSDGSQNSDEMCYYPYKCEECGQEGEERYRLDFQGHNVITDDGEIIEL